MADAEKRAAAAVAGRGAGSDPDIRDREDNISIHVDICTHARVWQTRRSVLLRQLLAAERALILRDREEDASYNRFALRAPRAGS